jgi:hypothetical protein
MSDYAKGVKKVPFDGAKEFFYLCTNHFLGSAATYNCQQAILGTVAMPKATDALDETKDAHKKLILARKMNETGTWFFIYL